MKGRIAWRGECEDLDLSRPEFELRSSACEANVLPTELPKWSFHILIVVLAENTVDEQLNDDFSRVNFTLNR